MRILEKKTLLPYHGTKCKIDSRCRHLVLIKQRPYDVIANPKNSARYFRNGFRHGPLAPSYDRILEGQEADLQTGLDALTKLTPERFIFHRS